MAELVERQQGFRRRSYDGWQRPSHLPYGDVSASSSSHSLKSSDIDALVKRTVSGEQNMQDTSRADRKSAVTNELSVEDVTDSQDAGYDADIDVQYPDEYDEPNTDDEKQLNIDVEHPPRKDTNLVEQFEKLFCEKSGRPDDRAIPRCNGKHRLTPLKRTRSQDSNLTEPDSISSTDSHEVLQGSKHYRRKRKIYHLRQDPMNHPDRIQKRHNITEGQEAMDVD